jgi:hypothetical protein
MMIVTTIYLQARAYVMQMTQHNGEYGCLFCLEAGEVVKSGKGNYRSYPYREVNPEPRTINNIQADACKATTSEKTDIHIRRYVGSSALHRPVLANIWL